MALCVATLVPLWSVPHLPFGDLAEHIDAITIWHHHDDPNWDFQRYYDLNIGPNPYFVFYFSAHLLAYLVSVERAVCILLSLASLALPLGFAWLARRFDRDWRLALFAFPLVWSSSLTTGFASFVLALGLMPVAIGLYERFCERPTLRRGLVAAAAGVLMFFTHLLPWLMYAGASGAIGLLHERRGTARESYGPRALVLLVSGLVAALVIATGSTLQMGGVFGHLWGRWSTPWEQIREFPDALFSGCATWVVPALTAALGAAWLWPFATQKRQPRRLHDWRAEACLALAVIGYFAMPRSLTSPTYWWGLNVRFGVMVALFATLAIRGTPQRIPLLVAAVLSIGFISDMAVHFRRAQKYCAGFEQLVDLPPAGSRVLFLIWDPWHDPSYRGNYAQLYSGYYQARRGGYMPWNFDDGFPLRYRVRYPNPSWRVMLFDWEKHAPYYDYVMTFHTEKKRAFGDQPVQQIAVAGQWRLFKLPGPRIDQSPGPAYPKKWADDPNWKPPK